MATVLEIVVRVVVVTSLIGCGSGVSVDGGNGSCQNEDDVHHYPWKEGKCFEISQVDGLEPIVAPGADITLTVVGRAISAAVEPNPAEGFHVQASVQHGDAQSSFDGANGVWAEDVGGWVVGLTAPEEQRDGYYVRISLYCSDDGSACAHTFGQAAQTTENHYFDVRQ